MTLMKERKGPVTLSDFTGEFLGKFEPRLQNFYIVRRAEDGRFKGKQSQAAHAARCEYKLFKEEVADHGQWQQ